MTLFAAREDSGDAEAEGRPLPPKRVRVGRGIFVAGVVLLLVLGFAPVPYVIEQPGPVYNTLGVDSPVGEKAATDAKPVLTVKDAKTYPADGALDLLTVSLVGDPQNLPSMWEVLRAWFDPTRTVAPVDAAFPPGETVEQQNQANAQLMSTSQQDATAAALTELGYRVQKHVVIAGLEPGTPAEGVFEEGDVVLSVNGVAVSTEDELRTQITGNGTERPATFVVQRDGRRLTLSVTPREEKGTPVVGIYLGTKYGTMPVEVDFQLTDIGGPSAGQMFALGIIDKLTPGSLTGGRTVAGTGTIDGDGNVGKIGGIRQKMYGARDAGATVFLAPKKNCDEVVGHIPDGLDVYAVSTLDDSLAVLKALSTGTSTAALPRCTAG